VAAVAPLETVRAPGITLVVVPAASLGVVVPDTAATARTVLEANPRADAVLDGPMFATARGEGGYDTFQHGTVEYLLLDAARGVAVPSQHPERGLTVSVRDGVAYVADGASVPAGATVAVQGYPTLVRNGVSVASTARDTERVGRAALGVFRDGRVVLASGVGAMAAFAERLAALGVRDAVYTDGGGSTGLVVRGPDGVLVGSDADDPDGRRVPSWLVAGRADPPRLDARSALVTAAGLAAVSAVTSLVRLL